MSSSVIGTKEASISIRTTAFGVALTNSDLNNTVNSGHIYCSAQAISCHSKFTNPLKMVVTDKNREVQDRLKIWHVVKETNSFVCVIFLSGPRLYRSKTLGCWQNDGWSMVRWLAIVKALKNLFQSTNKWPLHIVSITDALP